MPIIEGTRIATMARTMNWVKAIAIRISLYSDCFSFVERALVLPIYKFKNQAYTKKKKNLAYGPSMDGIVEGILRS
jgi:hypothetical protein